MALGGLAGRWLGHPQAGAGIGGMLGNLLPFGARPGSAQSPGAPQLTPQGALGARIGARLGSAAERWLGQWLGHSVGPGNAHPYATPGILPSPPDGGVVMPCRVPVGMN